MLTIFLQMGFIQQKQASNHVIGRCPFCGKDEHFFINTESANKAWDCKSCGLSGGYKKLLETAVKIGKENFAANSKALVDNRKISAFTFSKMDVGFLPVKKVFIIPVYSYDGKEIVNIKFYGFDSMRNAAGLSSAMYGLWRLPKDASSYKNVFIAEGEWDALALVEIVDKLKMKDTVVIGVPGAGT